MLAVNRSTPVNWFHQAASSAVLQPSDNVLKLQLQQLQEKGPSAWQVWYDEAVASKAASGGKAPKALYDSWEEFEDHVVHTHLVRRGIYSLDNVLFKLFYLRPAGMLERSDEPAVWLHGLAGALQEVFCFFSDSWVIVCTERAWTFACKTAAAGCS